MIIIKCIICSKDIHTHPSLLKSKKRFCSYICKAVWQRNRKDRKSSKITKECLICHKQFKIWPYEERRGREFCSKECRWSSLIGRIRLPKEKSYKKVRQEKIYRTWWGIKMRCNNPNERHYPRYGGRGIKCLWNSFEEFKNDMGELLKAHVKEFGVFDTTIERINNDGNYCKENCRWATRKEQAKNRRSRVEITYNGETRSIFEWADHLKLPRVALWLRIFRYNWPIEKAFNKHVRRS